MKLLKDYAESTIKGFSILNKKYYQVIDVCIKESQKNKK